MAEPGDFYEDDEPLEDVVRAFEAGNHAVTGRPRGWRCEHVSITASHLAGKPTFGCGCSPLPMAG